MYHVSSSPSPPFRPPLATSYSHTLHPNNNNNNNNNQPKANPHKERKKRKEKKMSNATNPQSATEGQQSPRSEDQFDLQIGAQSDAGKRGRDATATTGEQQQAGKQEQEKEEEEEEEEKKEGVKLESNPTPLLGRAREK